jgi:glyoxylate carboligase
MKAEGSVNGAESLVRTLVASGVDTCFANPGTSEMHFVAALDRMPGIRCVLALFEGVATGAADGYARLARRPAGRCSTTTTSWPISKGRSICWPKLRISSRITIIHRRSLVHV